MLAGIQQCRGWRGDVRNVLDRKSDVAEENARMGWDLGPVATAVERQLAAWAADDVVGRLWTKDHTVWSATQRAELTDRLGWLTLPDSMTAAVPQIRDLAVAEAERGTDHIVLLGMGGSSLAPSVFSALTTPHSGVPTLTVVDSTHPVAVDRAGGMIDPERTLFVLSSKSGTTTETRSLYEYFRDRFDGSDGKLSARFVAVTDPGTPLGQLAVDHDFVRTFHADPEVGGRYSALSHFGLVPGALVGVDITRVLQGAARMAALCGQEPVENPGAQLGAALGTLAKAGRDKLTFVTSGGLVQFAAWAEQLIAESTGKEGLGIVPVTGEELVGPDAYSADRVFVVLRQPDDHLARHTEDRIAALVGAGHPVIEIEIAGPDDLGAEFFRWEFAVALAGAVLGINPFDQPDVQLAKDLAREAMEQPNTQSQAATQRAPVLASDGPSLQQELATWLRLANADDYVSIQAYLGPSVELDALMHEARSFLQGTTRMATTVGYGPQFLHSTGQLHKGGPNTGLFLQLVSDSNLTEAPIPGTDYSFGALITAQAAGDRNALLRRGRRVVCVGLGADVIGGLEAVNGAFVAIVGD